MRIVAALIIGVVIAFLAAVMLAPRPGSHTPRLFLGIVNTLRQIDAAKEQFMIDSNAVPADYRATSCFHIFQSGIGIRTRIIILTL